MQPEIYRTIKDYPLYEVSNYGNVRSWNNGRWGKRDYPKILKQILNTFGYPVVGIDQKSFRVHRIVLETFGQPQPTPKHECCHNDGTRTNSHIDNLRWGTRKENAADKNKHGTMINGEESCKSKLKVFEVEEIRRLGKLGKKILTRQEIGLMFKVTRANINAIVNRKSWRHI